MNLPVAKAKKIAGELEQIRGSNETLEPSSVVEFARNHTGSVLHRCFTWDDGEAAEKWRLEEARSLIVSVRVQFPNLKDTTRFYVSLSTDRVQGEGYRTITDVLSASETREVHLRDALNELESVKRKFRHIQELMSVWESIASAKSKLARQERRGSKTRG